MLAGWALPRTGQPTMPSGPRSARATRPCPLQMPAIQRLMGALCFAKRAAAGRPSPYADLMAADLWGDLGEPMSSDASPLCAASRRRLHGVLLYYTIVLRSVGWPGNCAASWSLLPLCCRIGSHLVWLACAPLAGVRSSACLPHVCPPPHTHTQPVSSCGSAACCWGRRRTRRCW